MSRTRASASRSSPWYCRRSSHRRTSPEVQIRKRLPHLDQRGGATLRSAQCCYRRGGIMMLKKSTIAVAFFCVPLLAGCASGGLSKRETGALGGGALGAGAGALIGHATGHTAGGAAIGGALGALTGAVVGDQIQAGDNRSDAQDEELRRQRQEIEQLKRQPSRDRDSDYERY